MVENTKQTQTNKQKQHNNKHYLLECTEWNLKI